MKPGVNINTTAALSFDLLDLPFAVLDFTLLHVHVVEEGAFVKLVICVEVGVERGHEGGWVALLVFAVEEGRGALFILDLGQAQDSVELLLTLH